MEKSVIFGVTWAGHPDFRNRIQTMCITLVDMHYLQPGFRTTCYDYDNDSFLAKTKRLVSRMTAQS